MLVTQPTDGGVFRHVCDLAAGLADRGHDVVLVGPLRHSPPSLGCELLVLPLQRSVAPLRDARCTWGLAAAFHRIRPDVVHAHSSKSGALARLARIAAPRTPVIYTPHGYAFGGHFAPSTRTAYLACERLLAPLSSRVVCVCDAERALAARTGAGRRALRVYNGVPAAEESPVVGSEETVQGPIVAALALFRPGKGIHTLIEAFSSVLDRVPGARLRLFGDGPERAALERHARGLGVEGSVEFRGPASDAAAALRGASVFVHASWAEAFPYTVLDAMRLGLPLVATDVGGVREAVVDGVSGLVVPPQDAARLADAIATLLLDRSRARALGDHARLAVRRFSTDTMIDQLVAVYESAVHEPRRTRSGGPVLARTP